MKSPIAQSCGEEHPIVGGLGLGHDARLELER